MTKQKRLAAFVVCASVVLAMLIFAAGQAKAYDKPLDDDTFAYLVEQCEFREVPLALALAMIECESGFDASTVSKTHDYGLMQINRINHDWLKDHFGADWDPLNGKHSIRGGLYIFAGYNNIYSLDKALMAYNCGHAGAKGKWKEGIYSTDYTKKVTAAMKRWQEKLDNDTSGDTK